MNVLNSSTPNQESVSYLAALMAGYFVGAQSIALIPFWMGTIVEGFAVDEQTAGGLATLQLGVLGAVALLLSAGVHRINRQRFIQLGVALSIAGNLVSIYAFSLRSLELLFVARTVAGVGEGLALATATALAAGTANPIRTFSLLNGCMAIMAGIVFLGLPTLIRHFAAPGFFAAMMAAGVLAASLSRYLSGSTSLAPAAQNRTVNWAFGLRSWLVLTMLGLCAIVTGGVWAFAERVGINSVRLSLQTVGTVMAVAAFAAPLGPLIANFIGTRFGHTVPVVTGAVLYIGVAFAFGFAFTLPIFVVGAISHAIISVFLATYLSAYMAYLDPSGRVAAASPALISAGNALGPSVMAYTLVMGSDYQALAWTAVALLGVVIGGMTPLLRQSDREGRIAQQLN